MGTPYRLKVVAEDLSKEKVNRKNYKNIQKALFLDRDNTLIKCSLGKYVINKNEIEILSKNIENIIPISLDYDLVCLLTNQPVIAMGKISLRDLDEINSIVVKSCLSMGLKIDIVHFVHIIHIKAMKERLRTLNMIVFVVNLIRVYF